MLTRTGWCLLALGIALCQVGPEKVVAQNTDSTASRGISTATRDAPKGDVRSSAARGLEVYREQLCGICHRFKKAETEGAFGPPHDGFATIARERIASETYAGDARTPEEYIRESIVDPKAYVVPGYGAGFHQMPPYVDLTSEDLEALVRVLLQED